MYLFLLKKALPFTLTFIFGAALSGLLGLFWASDKKAESFLGTRSCDYNSRSRTRRHHLVAESRPLTILFKPDVSYPVNREFDERSPGPARVNVTFGADGEIKTVKPLAGWQYGRAGDSVHMEATWKAVERAAKGIRFTPETINGVPVTVERDIELRFLPE